MYSSRGEEGTGVVAQQVGYLFRRCICFLELPGVNMVAGAKAGGGETHVGPED